MKWMVITAGAALVLGILVRHVAEVPRPHGQSVSPGSSEVSSKPAQQESDSLSRSLAKQIDGLPKLPAALIQFHRTLLAAIEIETDADRRSDALDKAAESIPDAQLPAVLDSLIRLDITAAGELQERLVRRWAESEAPTAAAWAAQLPEGSARRTALEQIAFAWAEADPARAVAWVGTLPDGESRQGALLATAYEAARTDPLSALELALNLEPTGGRDDLLVHALSQWAGSDFTTAADWAGKVSDPKLRARLIIAAATASGEQDPATGATLIATGVDAGEAQDRAAVALVQRWAQSAPQAAAAWVQEFPESPAREAAAQNLVALWTMKDAEAAGRWLNELPEGTLRILGMTTHGLILALPDMTTPVE